MAGVAPSIGLVPSLAPLGSIDDVVFHVANVLRVPVLVAALLALAAVVVELGSLGVELARRRRRDPVAIKRAASAASAALAAGDADLASRHLAGAAWSDAMRETFAQILAEVAAPPFDPEWLSKCV